MVSVLLNKQEAYLLEEYKKKELRKKKEKFLKKKRTHLNIKKLSELFVKLNVKFSEILYVIPFKCYFSFYLYLILKSKVRFLEFINMPDNMKLALSQDFNIMQISKESGVSRNTIRVAYNELKKIGLVMETPECMPQHIATKSCLVFNDLYITAYDDTEHKVVFSTKLPIFYNDNKEIKEKDSKESIC